MREDAARELMHLIHHVMPTQRSMLVDRVRNIAFEKAVRLAVTPKSTVLELGAGTGLWSILAAKLGAKRVVAVEREPILANLIKEMVRQNGVADRVEVIIEDANKIELKEKFSLLLSEVIGNTAFDEGILPMFDHCKKFLERGAKFLPVSTSLMAAPVSLAPSRRTGGISLSTRPTDEILMHMPTRLDGFGGIRFCGEPKSLATAVLARKSPPLVKLRGDWRVTDKQRIDGFLLWSCSDLGGGVELDARDCSNWWPMFHPINPVKKNTHLFFTLNYAKQLWSVQEGDRRARAEWRGPNLAYARLKMGRFGAV